MRNLNRLHIPVASVVSDNIVTHLEVVNIVCLHKIRVLLDDVPLNTNASATVEEERVERGSHRLRRPLSCVRTRQPHHSR